jgi:hypothetical protein
MVRLILIFLIVSFIAGEAQAQLIPISNNWQWTQDGRGGGSQNSLTVSGDTLNIAPVDHVHFTHLDTILGTGTYKFRFNTQTRFVFAWRISPTDSTKGTGLIFQNEGNQGFSLIHVTWSSFYYGWHNASSFRNTVNSPLIRNQWHDVEIRDSGTQIIVLLDGEVLPFFEGSNRPVDDFLRDVEPGYIGIGGGEKGTVKYSGFTYSSNSDPSDVEPRIALDLDLATGDQGKRETTTAISTDDEILIDIAAVAGAKGNVGFQAKLKYDPLQFGFVNFELADLVSSAALIPHMPVDSLVEINVAILGGTMGKDAGSLGIAKFKVLKDFSGPAQIELVTASFDKPIGLWAEGSIITVGGTVVLPADFDGDGKVGFPDFIAFAQNFGSKKGDATFKAKFDLNKDGSVNFPDFVQFAQAFGKT